MIGRFFRNLCLFCVIFVVGLTMTAVGSSDSEDMPDISGSSGAMGDNSDEDRISLGEESDEASFPVTGESAVFFYENQTQRGLQKHLLMQVLVLILTLKTYMCSLLM